MSASSRQIVNEVNNTTHLDEALPMAVKRSRSSMGAEACSVYIYDTQTDRFVLMAADGVMPDEVGKAQVSSNEGLVGWVAAHEEVINLSNAADHPGFDHVSKTGDESFHGFLGAPIMHHGRTMGVLVAQKHERRSFSDGDAAFFTTLAFQVGGALHHLLAKWDFSRRLDEPARGKILIHGIPCAPGLSTGNIVLSEPADLQSTPDRNAQDIESEVNTFRAALIAAKNELHAGKERMRANLAGEALSLFDAYIIAALSRRVDFFSIGTNDLTQYLLAVDRSNPLVQGLHDNLHPAVVQVVGDIVQRAHRQNKPVGVCGEMAGDPASALLLLGLGVDSLSMTPSSLPRVKWTI
jgi:phosphotransferase system, enzyme I, PtsP